MKLCDLYALIRIWKRFKSFSENHQLIWKKNYIFLNFTQIESRSAVYCIVDITEKRIIVKSDEIVLFEEPYLNSREEFKKLLERMHRFLHELLSLKDNRLALTEKQIFAYNARSYLLMKTPEKIDIPIEQVNLLLNLLDMSENVIYSIFFELSSLGTYFLIKFVLKKSEAQINECSLALNLAQNLYYVFPYHFVSPEGHFVVYKSYTHVGKCYQEILELQG